MTKSFKVLLLLSFLVSNCVLFAQSEKKYIVITFEYDRTKDNHPSKNYYWVAQQDSLLLVNNKMYPLYFDEFSKEDLEECKRGEEVNIFTMYKGENFIFPENQVSEITKLKELVLSKSQKVQEIRKKWNNKDKETIIVYITPICGKFCLSNIASYSGKDINYYGKIALPLSDFKYNEDFWLSANSKEISLIDFLKNSFINKN